MNHLSDYHYYLLAGKIAGNLTSEEAHALDGFFQSDPELLSIYRQMLSELPTDMVEGKFRSVDQPRYWKKAAELRPPGNKTAIPLLLKISVAAISIGLVFLLWFWYPSGSTQKEITDIPTTQHPGIQLKLATGKIVDLSAQQGNIVEDHATLINEAKSLTYSTTEEQAGGINTVLVPAGMDYQVTLSDGSKIWMNSMTRLDFPFQFSPDKREITLEGEAYIQVAEDSLRPFTVHLPGSSVMVLGTAFNVNTYDSSTVKVALVEGSVNLNWGSSHIRLIPGQQAVCTISGTIKQETFNPRTVLSWREGVMYFEYADLMEIGKVLERWFGVQIRIDNPGLSKKRIKGVLTKDQPLSVFLDDLKFIANITSQLDKDGVLHFK